MPTSLEPGKSITADREIILTRLYDAPVALVFDAWTHPNHVVNWWGPNGFRTTVQHMDVRPGGIWKLIMHGPDGRDYQNHMVFLQVERPTRLVYRHEPEPGTEDVSHTATITFAEQEGKTHVTLHMVFDSPEEFEQVERQYHAIEGGRQHLGRLAEYLPQMA